MMDLAEKAMAYQKAAGNGLCNPKPQTFQEALNRLVAVAEAAETCSHRIQGRLFGFESAPDCAKGIGSAVAMATSIDEDLRRAEAAVRGIRDRLEMLEARLG